MGEVSTGLNNISNVANAAGGIPGVDTQKVGEIISGAQAAVALGQTTASTANAIAKKLNLNNPKELADKDSRFDRKRKRKQKRLDRKAARKAKFASFKALSFGDKLKMGKDYLVQNKTLVLGIIAAQVSANMGSINELFALALSDYEKLVESIEEARARGDIDFIKSRITGLRNRLTVLEYQLDSVVKLLDQAAAYAAISGLIVTALLILLEAISNISFIPAGVIDKGRQVISLLQKIIAGILLVVGIALPILQSLLDKVRALKARLDELENELNNPEGNKTDESLALFNGIQLGEISGVEYNGYRFVIKEDTDPKFEVNGFRRHYAVAIDRDNVEAYVSKYSYTSDPNVLIDELKLQIDGNNLKI
jgi:hypothetical protein